MSNQTNINTILHGDAFAVLKNLPDTFIQTCITSPPYYGLRDYGIEGQIGLEETPEAYVEKLVRVFREVRRVLRDDGTLWVNLGDSYANDTKWGGSTGGKHVEELHGDNATRRRRHTGLKSKDLIGIPWSVAKALQQPYYTGRIASERDRVWLTATIDAEGSICGFTHERKDDGRTRTGIHITITNTNKTMLDNAQRIWTTTRIDHNLHGKGHYGSLDTYRWIAHNVDDKSLLLRELYPYFIAKQKQALLAWNFLELSRDAKHLARTREAQEIKDKRAWLVHAISRLNHFEDIDIPNWCIEPSSLYEPGWYLRSDVIWHKPTAMPESVTDRPTTAHEHIFLLAKSERYFYDADVIREPGNEWKGQAGTFARTNGKATLLTIPGQAYASHREDRDDRVPIGRNKRTVWTVASQPFAEAHFATFPPKLIEPCILAGTSPQACEHCGAPWERVTARVPMVIRNGPKAGGYGSRTTDGLSGTMIEPARAETVGWQSTCTCKNEGLGHCLVLDPFMGAGTTALVALLHHRDYLGIELNQEYITMAKKRIATVPQVLWTGESEAVS